MKVSIYSKEHKVLVDKIKQARIEAKLGQEEAAKLLGTTQSYISKLESGQRQVNALQLKELANLYKKSVSYFFK